MNVETVDYKAPDAKEALTRSLHNTGSVSYTHLTLPTKRIV